ncbi:LysR family transcriptional regulator [Salinivibrio proteolyticus]|nr:LysR family transcriptional regulator [Salinivibrio proteolyticus]OOF14187.1 hypothetical protein BZG84_14510 [Salinivibrio sp. PR932]OOF14774.1 hypothetical protein BZG83_05125 [Salinivibrio sp. PR919]OOF30054.1 hypothetical protein BZJ20_12510 [Salinivibrio proteolyticus]
MTMFTFEQVEAFVAVVECGSFSAAARRIKKDKSSVHQLVSYLEIELGVDLFNRDRKLPVLKDEAKEIYNYSKLLLEQQKEIQSLADGIFHGIEGSLTISYDTTIPRQVIVEVRHQLLVEFPSSKINLLCQNKTKAIHDLSDQVIDMSIQILSNRAKPKDGLDALTLGQIACSLYVNKPKIGESYSYTRSYLQVKPQFILESFLASELEDLTILSPFYCSFTEVNMMVECLNRTPDAWTILPDHLASPFVDDKIIKITGSGFSAQEVLWPCVLLTSQKGAKGPVFQRAYELIIEKMRLFDLS